MVSPLNSKITNLYFEQGDLPVAPNELREWVNTQTKIASSIQDFSLYYDKKNENIWTSENRKFLMDASIKRYEEDLEVLKKIASAKIQEMCGFTKQQARTVIDKMRNEALIILVGKGPAAGYVRNRESSF